MSSTLILPAAKGNRATGANPKVESIPKCVNPDDFVFAVRDFPKSCQAENPRRDVRGRILPCLSPTCSEECFARWARQQNTALQRRWRSYISRLLNVRTYRGMLRLSKGATCQASEVIRKRFAKEIGRWRSRICFIAFRHINRIDRLHWDFAAIVHDASIIDPIGTINDIWRRSGGSRAGGAQMSMNKLAGWLCYITKCRHVHRHGRHKSWFLPIDRDGQSTRIRTGHSFNANVAAEWQRHTDELYPDRVVKRLAKRGAERASNKTYCRFFAKPLSQSVISPSETTEGLSQTSFSSARVVDTAASSRPPPEVASGTVASSLTHCYTTGA